MPLPFCSVSRVALALLPRGPHLTHLHQLLCTPAGANVTWWNLSQKSGGAIALPPCDFGPLLYFVGRWLPPSASSGGVADADSIDLPLASAASSDGAAAPAPAAAAAPSAAAPGYGPLGPDGTRAGALASTGWCARERWRVELVSSGYKLWPADLATAQVAARRRGML